MCAALTNNCWYRYKFYETRGRVRLPAVQLTSQCLCTHGYNLERRTTKEPWVCYAALRGRCGRDVPYFGYR